MSGWESRYSMDKQIRVLLFIFLERFWRWISDKKETVFSDWYRYVVECVPGSVHTLHLHRKPRRGDGASAYVDNTGQAGWFNYHFLILETDVRYFFCIS